MRDDKQFRDVIEARDRRFIEILYDRIRELRAEETAYRTACDRERADELALEAATIDRCVEEFLACIRKEQAN